MSNDSNCKNLTIISAAVLSIFVMNGASAGIITYSGSDDGANTSGPFTNSATAEANFQAAAGTTNLITFENQPVGYNASFTAAPGVTVSLTGINYGSGYSGISGTTFGNLYGFNVTSGGRNWLGFPTGAATFTFDSGIDAFGFYLTGTQTVFSSGIDILFFDGSQQHLFAPINANGGASYFGFTDVGASIASIQIINTSSDAWGIDNVSYGQNTTVPEPATLALMGLSLVGLGLSRRKAKSNWPTSALH